MIFYYNFLTKLIALLTFIFYMYRFKESLLSTKEKAYLCGIIGLQVFYSFGAKMLGIEDKLPFLPLMLISTYSALGVIYAWVSYLQFSLQKSNVLHKVTFKKDD